MKKFYLIEHTREKRFFDDDMIKFIPFYELADYEISRLHFLVKCKKADCVKFAKYIIKEEYQDKVKFKYFMEVNSSFADDYIINKGIKCYEAFPNNKYTLTEIRKWY